MITRQLWTRVAAALAVVGVVLALPAIVLVAMGGETPEAVEQPTADARVIAESVAGGVMFGLFFVFFSRAGDDAGMWPTVAARVASVSFLTVVVAVWTRRSGTGALRVARVSLPMIAGAGAFDVMANGLYLQASTMGLLSLISVVSAMYPASTVALARVVLGERMHRTQIVGLTLAAGAVSLVALGRS